MDDKRQIIKSFQPMAVLKPITEEALMAIPQNFRTDGLVGILKFPFRIGRESRVQKVEGKLLRIERPKFGGREPNNDLYLIDQGHKLNISREHFQVEKVDGSYQIVDRGSVCGTKIDGTSIGGDEQGGREILNDGDTILVGCNSTPYAYKFIVLEDVYQEEEE